MSDKIINTTLKDKIREKAGPNLPESFDFNSIGKIDLKEAEIIANEEIVFLSEDDLIDGLEDFELIPVKTSSGINNSSVNTTTDSAEFTERSIELQKAGDVYEDVIFEDFSAAEDEHVLIHDEADTININKEEINEPALTSQEEIFFEAESQVSETGEIVSESHEREDVKELLYEDEADVIELDLDEIIAEDSSRNNKAESEILQQKINENNFNTQFDNIIKNQVIDEDYEFIPGIYDDNSAGVNIKFIDDSHVEKKQLDSYPVFESDPLTENLVRMVDVSDGTLLILDEAHDARGRIEYILDDTRTYDADSLSLLFREEMFMDDTDFDFIDNAIVRDDYTVYIQEIDEYLKSREALSGSEVYEILGLLPEEIDDIDEKLFGDYYKELDDEYELEFFNSELSFFDRGFIRKKDLRYFTKDDYSLLENEKQSIEEDITSESAIIFEEDVSDIQRLFVERGESSRIADNGDNFEAPADEVNSGTDDAELIKLETDQLSEIIDITESIVILEDKMEIDRITSQFPEKREELVKLLSYLDGLLEKLPEESIRKFAESEYFDLYSKVLKEIGK